jgi:protein-S-isoprenylcysteine O-methyltransferase Ste14
VTAFDAQLIYAVAWLTFGAGHSLLAGETLKRRLHALFGAYYRLCYNIFAVVHLALVWLVGAWAFRGLDGYDLGSSLGPVPIVVNLAGWLVMLVGLRGYDLGRLGGTRQIRNHLKGIDEPEDEPLRLDGLHGYVRHPLYSAGFLILWGRVSDEFSLATAVWGSLYLLIGSGFEERRLLRLYGTAYADYRARVPAFVPWKGRVV